jgi:hypothetical protein
MRTLLCGIFLCLLVYGLAPVPAAASWPAQGLAVAAGPGQQIAPLLCRDGAGGVLISWLSVVDDTSADVYIQRFASDGTVALGWPSHGVKVARASVYNSEPAYTDHEIATDGTGGAFVLWQSGLQYSNAGDRVTHVTSAGQIAGGWPLAGLPLVAESEFISGAMLLADETGGVFAAWSDLQDGQDLHVHVQHLRSDGVPFSGWPAGGVRPKAGSYAQHSPVLALDEQGGAWVGWADENYPRPSTAVRASGNTRVVHHVTSAGVVDPSLPAAGIQLSGFEQNVDLGLISDSAGGTFAVWNGGDVSETRFGLFAQRLAPGGVVAPGWPADGLLYSTSGFVFNPRAVVPDGAGGFIAAWDDFDSAAQKLVARAQRVRADASLAPGWEVDGVRLGFAALDYSGGPKPIADGLGGATIAWADSAQADPTTDLFAQHVSANGVAALFPTGGRMAVCTAPGVQAKPEVTSDGAGGAYMAWVDQRADTGDVYLKRVSLGDITASTSGDPPGLRAGIALSRPTPNPSTQTTEFALTLPNDGAVDAVITDIAGRTRRHLGGFVRPVRGTQTVTWDGRDDAGHSVAPGVYELIVRAGTMRASVRVVRIR